MFHGNAYFQPFWFCFNARYEFSFLALHHHGETGWGGNRRRGGGSQRVREDQRALAQTNCTSELTFLFLLFSIFALLSFPQTTKAFLPKMLELNHGHIVTVASSLGLFSTAGVEVSIIHNNAYPSHRSHHPKTSAFLQSPRRAR